MTEEQLLRSVLDLTRWLDIFTHHCRPARTDKGWRTPIAGNRGFPDLVLIGPFGGILWRELKSQRGRLDPAQVVWGDRLRAGGGDWDVWRPDDWLSGRIERELKALAKGAAHV